MSFEMVGKVVVLATVVVGCSMFVGVVRLRSSDARYRWANQRSRHGTRATLRHRLGIKLIEPLLNVQFIELKRRIAEKDFGSYRPVGDEAVKAWERDEEARCSAQIFALIQIVQMAGRSLPKDDV